MSASQPPMLAVEDSDDDVFFLKRALSKANIDLPVQVAVNGEEAIQYLEGTGRYANRAEHPLPSLVLLDLKLPFIHGFEVLKWIRAHPSLKDLRVVILTSSPEERDRAKAHELGANGYYVKPPTAEMLLQILGRLGGDTARPTGKAG